MSTPTTISNHDGLTAGVLRGNGRNPISGLMAYTERARQQDATIFPMLNPVFGDDLAQAAGFTGSPTTINDGGDTLEPPAWVGVAGAGNWDFADTNDPDSGLAHVSLTNASNNNNATFTGATPISGSSNVAITMRAQLVSYSDVQNNMELSLSLAGSPIGSTVLIDNYINTGLLGAYQNVSIPFIDLGVGASSFDELTINVTHITGPKPTLFFDTIQVEESGGTLQYSYSSPTGTRTLVGALRYVMARAVVGPAAQEYDDLLGAALPNGIGFLRTKSGSIIAAGQAHDLADFCAFNGFIATRQTGTANSLLCIDLVFPEPLEIDSKTLDKIIVSVNDDMTSFLRFTVTLTGTIEGST